MIEFTDCEAHPTNCDNRQIIDSLPGLIIGPQWKNSPDFIEGVHSFWLFSIVMSSIFLVIVGLAGCLGSVQTSGAGKLPGQNAKGESQGGPFTGLFAMSW